MSESCNHDCSSCSSNCSSRDPKSFLEQPHPNSKIGKVIGVVSGKGGVGKSMVTDLLAVSFAKKGLHCGILDADITGPSIPKAFGITERAMGNETTIFPVASKKYGIDVMSINLLLPNDTDPVVWRVDGILVVTSPQDLVSMIVGKAMNMAKMMNIPVLGLVENMSYALCPDCGKKILVFGESHIAEVASMYSVPVLAQMPINPAMAAACDKGTVEDLEVDYLEDAVQMILASNK